MIIYLYERFCCTKCLRREPSEPYSICVVFICLALGLCIQSSVKRKHGGLLLPAIWRYILSTAVVPHAGAAIFATTDSLNSSCLPSQQSLVPVSTVFS